MIQRLAKTGEEPAFPRRLDDRVVFLKPKKHPLGALCCRCPRRLFEKLGQRLRLHGCQMQARDLPASQPRTWRYNRDSMKLVGFGPNPSRIHGSRREMKLGQAKEWMPVRTATRQGAQRYGAVGKTRGRCHGTADYVQRVERPDHTKTFASGALVSGPIRCGRVRGNHRTDPRCLAVLLSRRSPIQGYSGSGGLLHDTQEKRVHSSVVGQLGMERGRQHVRLPDGDRTPIGQ